MTPSFQIRRLFFLTIIHAYFCRGLLVGNETEARLWLEDYNRKSMQVTSKYMAVYWAYNTNLTDHNKNIYVNQALVKAAFDNEAARNASRLYNWRSFEDKDLRRQFQMVTELGFSALPKDKLSLRNNLIAEMERIFSTAKVCNKPGDKSSKCYPLFPDLTNILANSHDWDELLWAWKGWRDATGKKMKKKYQDYVRLSNLAAVLNSYQDAGDSWRSSYEMTDFEAECLRLWNQVKPFYQQLHAYVRRKLAGKYKGKKFPEGGHIPAHLLGNMWSQSWSSIFNTVKPYPHASTIDVTKALQAQKYNVSAMFHLSEEFFISLGLLAMPEDFWENSMIEKPSDRDAVCYGAAWDFYDQRRFRIMQCTDITQDWLLTTHHEMGHIQYFLQYKDQPVMYRDGANPGFHEALGDVISLSVQTPEHLKEIGLLDSVQNSTEADINFLMSQALEKIAFLPFGYLIDQWRWGVFRGNTTIDTYNRDWWKIRCKYQGIAPPVSRSEDDFDPGAKYHVGADTPYIRYFVSHITQFQFHKALCRASGNSKPLHRCDIYRSKAAGKKLSDMMKLGSSKPWPFAMQTIADTDKMDASALLEYFQPLMDWLQKENQGHHVGWEEACPAGTMTNKAWSYYKIPILCFTLIIIFSRAFQT